MSSVDWSDPHVRRPLYRAILLHLGVPPTAIADTPKRMIDEYLAALPTIMELYHD